MSGRIINSRDGMEDFLRNIQELDKKVYIEKGVMHINLASDYHFNMASCNTPMKLVGWIRQLNEKTWMTPEALDKVIVLACDYHGMDINEF